MRITSADRLIQVLTLLAVTASFPPACSESSPANRDADADGNADLAADTDADAGADADVEADAPVDDAGDAEDGAEAVFPPDHPRIYLDDANRTRLAAMLSEGRAAATRFRDMVDNQLDGADYYAFRASDAALLWQLTGDASYADYAIGMVEDFVAAEEALIAGGERAEVAADSYLYVGEDVGEVALVYDWCFDRLTTDQRARWLAYADQAVWNVWHPDEATWNGNSFPWSGWSIDNPSNNYYYSFLRATMLLGLAARGELPSAETWISTFRDAKLETQLFPTFERDLTGGGSREGTGYGVSMARLFELYDWWEASTGERVADRTAHTRASLPAMLHSVVPTMDRIAPIGDHARDSTAALFDYHRRYIQILDWLYRSDALAAIGKGFLDACSVPEMGNAFMFLDDFLYDQPELVAAPLDGLYPAYYAPGTGQLYARSSWDVDATWVSFLAGPYTESHAHRDQGSFLVYKREWLADDQNLRSHSGIRQEEELHNLVRIEQGGATVQLAYDTAATLEALADEPLYSYFAADVTPSYGGDPAVTRVEREVVFVKPDVLVVFDRVDAAAGTRRVWQLNSAAHPSVAGNVIDLSGTSTDFLVWMMAPGGTTADVVDWTTDDDMNGGWRVDVADDSAGGRSRFLHVLSLDGAATGVGSSDDGTRSGAGISLAAGGSAVVRFENDGWGGTLQLLDAGGGVVLEVVLESGVEALPVLEGGKAGR
ncbi:MAG: hypothetical protein HY905_12895 [Deltaproteobacteria bacterium]|nr:hypothetical protein [Deltaproteobacteria bacterium]